MLAEISKAPVSLIRRLEASELENFLVNQDSHPAFSAGSRILLQTSHCAGVLFPETSQGESRPDSAAGNRLSRIRTD
jgi:membrane-bound ClpP family serine protease